jgi:hypothetical protein
MQPIWVTVHVPTNAAAGDYEATLTIEADNEKTYTVPVRITVHEWLLPDPRQYAVRNMGWVCPERLAIYYDLPMWGEKHLELCARSLEMMLFLGSRHAEVNLVLHYASRDNTAKAFCDLYRGNPIRSSRPSAARRITNGSSGPLTLFTRRSSIASTRTGPAW